MDILKELEIKAEPADKNAMRKARAMWDGICKPLSSLGLLEDMVVKLAGMTKTADVRLDRRCVIVVCADNGVVEEGVTQSDSDVTASVALEIAEGKSNINVMAQAARMDTFGVDIGIKKRMTHPGLLDMHIADGTKNIAKEPAMTRAQAIAGIRAGVGLVQIMKERGYQIIATGEMGIGNTTTSSAIASVLLDMPPASVTGKGAGLSGEGLKRKIAVIEKAIQVNQPDVGDPVDVLAKLGGYDIAAMTGMFLGGAKYHVPVVIDGLISSIAALLAKQIQPLSTEYMLASHVSKEPAGVAILERLGLQAVIQAELHLGEGTGAVCLLPLLDVALAEYHNAHRFSETDVEQYVKL